MKTQKQKPLQKESNQSKRNRQCQFFYSHICAAAENNTIGLKGKLPWNIPEDLQFFQKKTKGKPLIMGRKTFESLGTPLPHRLNVVVTRQKKTQPKINVKTHTPIWTDRMAHVMGKEVELLAATKKALSVIMCPSIKEAMDFCSQKTVLQNYGNEIFIIGGGEIYKQTLPLVDCIYLTRIHKSYKGDAFYPDIPREEFRETDRKDCDGRPPYSFITYKRV